MSDETPTTRRCRRAGIRLGMRDGAFLLPALSCVTFREDRTIPTMVVTLDGLIRVNPDFVKMQPDDILGGCVAHELMHLMMLHTARLKNRDFKKWNLATDMAINQILREGNIPLPPGCLYPPHHLSKASAEQIYDLMKDTGAEDQAQEGQVGAGCGLQPGEGDSPGKDGQGSGQDGQGSGQDGEEEQTPEQRWKECSVQARAMSAGTQAGRALARALAPPPARTKYHQVIRSAASRATAQHGRDDQTWSKASRRAPEDIILPGWCATKARGAVIIDSSGSVSDEMLAQAASETAKIQQSTPGIKLLLVVHDVEVHFADWVNAGTATKVQECLRGRGGTSFDPAYRKVEEMGGRLDFCVHLTDCGIYGWPDLPRNVRRFIVARLGNSGDPVPMGVVEILVE